MCLAPPLTQLTSYTVVMDAAPGPDTSNSDLQLQLVSDPIINENAMIHNVDLNIEESIRISVSGH